MNFKKKPDSQNEYEAIEPGTNQAAAVTGPGNAIAAGQQHAGGDAAAQSSILDLPDDVKKNIVGYEDLELDEMLTRIVCTFDAAIAVDRIIMLLYTTYGRSPDRAKVLARLRSLDAAGVLEKVAGVRSMYRKKSAPIV